jgi:hypothetical protein
MRLKPVLQGFLTATATVFRLGVHVGLSVVHVVTIMPNAAAK